MPHVRGLISRRDFFVASASALATEFVPGFGFANVPLAYDWNASPPAGDRTRFIDWMVKNRGEDSGFLGQRWDRVQQLLAHHDCGISGTNARS